MTIAVYEESREDKIGRDGLEITRTFRVEPYILRGVVLDALLGGVRLYAGRLVRLAPARDPWYPWCFCTDVKVSHVEVLDTPGSNVGLAQLFTKNYAESARLVCTYKSLDHEEKDVSGSGNEQSEKEIATEAWEHGGVTEAMPLEYWKWQTDNQLMIRSDMVAWRTVPTLLYSLTRNYVANLPHEALGYMEGRVNKRQFLTGKKSKFFNAECVRFDGAHVDLKHTNQGLQFATMKLNFAVRRIYDLIDNANTFGQVTWNRIYRDEKGWWEKPRISTGLDRGRYLLDEDAPSQTIGGREVKGFDLLFHPAAS